MSEPIIKIQSVYKYFDGEIALNNINFDVMDGEFLTLLGPSGCGKTTLLRILAGFEQPDSGTLTLKNEDITYVPPELRHVNLVFQNYALFPHMTIFENIAFGLRCQKLDEAEIEQRVYHALDMVHLQKHSNKMPQKLSGGQQQRVALARAVVNRPNVLLLDEPFSALDYSLRKNMRIELKQLQRELGITFIFVTHDQEEALSMSDRIVIMNDGNIQQIDTARKVYEEPKNLFTASFIGEANIFETQVKQASTEKIDVDIESVIFSLDNRKNFKQGDKLYIIIRPEDIDTWSKKEVGDTPNYIPGEIEQVIYKGCTIDLIIKFPSGKKVSVTEFFDEDDPNLAYNVGEKVWCDWKLGWEVILPHEE